MAGEKASGDLSGSASINSDGGMTSIALKASGSGIKRGDLVITKPVADITIADLKALAIKGNLSVETFAQGAQPRQRPEARFRPAGGQDQCHARRPV